MFTLNCKGTEVIIDKPVVMGIINTTDDSFYEGSRINNIDSILKKVETMLNDGAVFIDIGAQSTRPGNIFAGAEQELVKLLPVIDTIHKNFPATLISVDTYHSNVARESVAAGASMVNDISGGTADADMFGTVGGLGVPYVCMHINGTPITMHDPVSYDNITRDVIDFFISKTAACRLAGIHDVIVDPGFGFSKQRDQNLELLKHLPLLKILQKPVLAGLSRKSTIYKTLGITAGEALNGTTVMNTLAILNGADILRVHDVKEAIQVIKLLDSYMPAGSK